MPCHLIWEKGEKRHTRNISWVSSLAVAMNDRTMITFVDLGLHRQSDASIITARPLAIMHNAFSFPSSLSIFRPFIFGVVRSHDIDVSNRAYGRSAAPLMFYSNHCHDVVNVCFSADFLSPHQAHLVRWQRQQQQRTTRFLCTCIW